MTVVKQSVQQRCRHNMVSEYLSPFAKRSITGDHGYRRIQILLSREGWKVNHKRVYRLYKQDGLELRLKTRKKKTAALPRTVCLEATTPNDRWSIDFVSDRLAVGRACRVLLLVDSVSHVSPAIDAQFSKKDVRVCEVLNRAIVAHRPPRTIRPDNGPEFAGKALDAWAYRRGVKLCVSRPGKPTDNAFCESFNGKLRDEFLATHWIENIADVGVHLQKWRENISGSGRIVLWEICLPWSGWRAN